ncbi:hypothetical protein CJ030_MR4G003059 [Morella rubra]|uniref:Uncharacterized protein n=1 Tax=Morella rubra TaxID=262757 RepID=A0A6A1VU64_9ROSI|nr:hypothetical protein CJ030_MR4G003059 [Morella rubra]
MAGLSCFLGAEDDRQLTWGRAEERRLERWLWPWGRLICACVNGGDSPRPLHSSWLRQPPVLHEKRLLGEGAASSGPDTSRPVLGRGWEGIMGEALQLEAAALEDGVICFRLDGWPDREATAVNQG